MAKILLVEDEPDLARLVRDWLEADMHLIDIVSNGLDALHCLDLHTYDLMVLDLQLPGVDGMEVCRRYRSGEGGMPILMLTAKSSVDEKEAGLNAGADDYVTKPFHLKELSARIRVLLRRSPTMTPSILLFQDICLDTNECQVKKNGTEVHLLPQEYRLLEFFMRHPNQVFSTELLFDRVWESEAGASLDTVRGHIMRLRSKLDSPGAASIVETVRGLGYKHSSDA